jgi:hypothetical protein
VPNATQLCSNLVEQSLLPLALRFPPKLKPFPIPLGSADMRETKKIERLGFPFASLGSPFGSKTSELDQACLLRMDFERKPPGQRNVAGFWHSYGSVNAFWHSFGTVEAKIEVSN